MQMVKIRFKDSTNEAKGFVALAKRGRVVCFPDDTYEIAKSRLEVLDELKIPYEVITEEAFDYSYHAHHALRNSFASKV